MTDLQRRIARARLLRREGKTYDEIRAALDVPVSDDRLQGWLKGIPRPPGTRRSCPKTELRSECRRLRAQGLTYDEIAAKTGASKGSISPWVRDVTPPHGVHRERLEHTRDSRRMEALRESARTRSRLAARRRELHSDVAAASIGPLADLELFLVGVALYWAEGTKSKPYDLREHLTFVNSDPSMIEVFLAWLKLVGVQTEDCRFRVSIHETADIPSAEAFWAQLVGLPTGALSRTTVKRHRPLTNRLNVGENYKGCLVISVLRSAALYRSVSGWWTGMHAQITRSHRRGTDWGEVRPWRGWQSQGAFRA